MRNDFSTQRSALTHRTAKLGTTLSGFVLLLLGQACGSRYQIGELEPPPGESPPPPGEASTGADDIVPILVLDNWKDADAHLDISHNRLLVVGDVDGDGFGDFDDHGQLVYGTPRAAPGRRLGIENGPFFSISGDAPLGDGVVSAGDFNGDGYSDLLITGIADYSRSRLSEPSSEALGADNEFLRNVSATKAFLWYGGPERGCCKHVLEDEAVGFRVTEDLTGPTRAALAEGGDGQYLQVSYQVRPLALGDLDGDGSDDFAITATAYWREGNETESHGEGMTYIYYGQREHFALATDREPDSRIAGVLWIQPMGDLNGDGHADILVLTPTGGLSLIGGSARRLPAIAALDAIGVPLLAASDLWATSPLGDIDGDGRDDFSVTSIEGEAEERSNYIFYGSPSLLGGPVDRSAASANILTAVGEPLSGAGDCNGDGRADLLIGQNTPAADGDHGSTIVVTSASRRFSGQYELPLFASEFADSNSVYGEPAGDLDGDGLADLFLSTAPPNRYGENTWYVKYGTPLPNPIR